MPNAILSSNFNHTNYKMGVILFFSFNFDLWVWVVKQNLTAAIDRKEFFLDFPHYKTYHLSWFVYF